MYHKVLVPYDMSDPAQHALVAALELVADVPDAQVTVLNVVDWQDYNAETFKILTNRIQHLLDANFTEIKNPRFGTIYIFVK